MPAFVTFRIFVLLAVFTVHCCIAFSQGKKIAVLPFENLHGLIDYNQHCYELADSVARALQHLLKEHSNRYVVIEPDSVDFVVLEYNLNPDNPQFQSDRWIVAEKLGAQLVVTGTVKVRYNKVFVNAAVYNIETKLPEYEIKNLYTKEENYLELSEKIAKGIAEFLISQKG